MIDPVLIALCAVTLIGLTATTIGAYCVCYCAGKVLAIGIACEIVGAISAAAALGTVLNRYG